MRRSVALISVGITAFSIVLMASVVYGLRAAASPRVAPVTEASFAPVADVSPELQAASDVQSPTISPQAAITLASAFLEREDAYSVQLADYNGVEAYLVTFSSGDLVYVSLSGQVLGSVPAPVQMANANSNGKDRDERGGSGGGEGHRDGEGAQEPEHEVEGGN